MSEIKSKPTFLSDNLAKEYKRQQAMITAQPTIIQQYLEVQGKQIAEAIVEGRSQVCFSLPDQIVYTLENPDQPTLITIPLNYRAYSTGNFMNRVRKVELHEQLRHSLTRLEQSPDRVVSFATSLLHHAAVMHIVYNMLPAGRSVAYKPADEGEAIHFIPEDNALEPDSGVTVATGTITARVNTKAECTELLVPFVPYTRKFFMPQWVAFDENSNLLVKSLEEANAHIKSMQRYMEVVFLAAALAPYISADNEYVRKRDGMLGQLVNQGQALAIFHTKEIIAFIQQRAASGYLNRGLSLSLPYFNDQELRSDILKIEIIPAGRVMFVPAFVVLAMRREEMKVSRDTRLNPSTRKHLFHLLELIRQAFETS